MRGRALCWVLALLVVGVAAWAGADIPKAKPAAVPAVQVQAAALTVNGAASPVAAGLAGGVPMVALRSAVTAMDAKVKVGPGEGGQILLRRAQATVRIAVGAKEMSADGQTTALTAAPVVSQGTAYVPEGVLKALFPDYAVALTYNATNKTVAMAYAPKPPKPLLTSKPTPAPGPVTPPATASLGCDNTSGATGVPTQEFGKAGAKVEIISLLPITHGCHVRTEAELKKAYQAHPSDIHLIIVDLFGPEASKYQAKVPGGFRAVVSINGKTSFQYAGRTVNIEKPEGGSYQVSDIVPIIENEIKNSK